MSRDIPPSDSALPLPPLPTPRPTPAVQWSAVARRVSALLAWQWGDGPKPQDVGVRQ